MEYEHDMPHRTFVRGSPRKFVRMTYGLAALSLCGCEATQSALKPAGPAAAKIAVLSWVMIIAFTLVFLLVCLLLAVALFHRSRNERAAPPLGRTGFVVAGGIVLPVVVVIPLLIYSLETSHALQIPEESLTVRLTGHQWWWEVEYPDQNIVTANQIHIPVGQPVRLELTSADVIHSFWVPELNGKRDMIPGDLNEFWIQADRPGIYRGQCAEYCGLQHAHMALVVVALPPDEFLEWAAGRNEPESVPATEQQQNGLAVFLKAGCSRCHTIRGTPADGKIGPDLTHIGSRETLGAGTVPNIRGNLMGWIGDPGAVKPGVRMPATYLPPEELDMLATYLESLK